MRIFIRSRSFWVFAHCNTSWPQVYDCSISHSRQTVAQWKALDYRVYLSKNLRHWTLSSLRPYVHTRTSFIIANVETFSQDDSTSHSFSSDGHEFEPTLGGGLSASEGDP